MADRKISDLTALTTPASGDYLPIVDISEAAAASKNKRITIEELFRGIPLGTAGAPSIAIEGDEDTGIYSPGANQLAISTNGTGRLFVDASGNVGLGTAGPTSKIHLLDSNVNVNTALGAETGILLRNTNTTNGNMCSISNRDGNALPNAQINFINVTHASVGAIGFTTRNGGDINERLRITSDGKVGVGTTSPTGLIHGYINANAQLIFQNSSQNNLYVSGTNATVVVDSTGSSYPGFYVKVGGTAVGSLEADGTNALDIVGSSSSTPIRFRQAATERARIDSSGRLLVGTSSARANFFNTSASAVLQMEGTGTSRRVSILGASDGSAYLILGRQKGSAGQNVVVAGEDELGAVSFQGNDGTEFVEAATITASVDGTPGANDMPGRLVFSTTADGASSPTERMRITNLGRVGIGTTSPSQPLEVRGPVGGTEYHVAVGDANLARILVGYKPSGFAGTTNSAGISADNFGSVLIGTRSDVANTITFGTSTGTGAATERARIDSSGRLLVGTTSSRSNVFGQPIFQIESVNAMSSVTETSNNQYGGAYILAKTRGSSFQALSNGDTLGILSFQGSNGSALLEGARIDAVVDGTVSGGGASDLPTRLVFATTADGAASPTERMRLTSTGQLRLAGAGITFNGDTATANELDDYEEGTWTPTDVSGGSLTFAAASGRYTKIGRLIILAAGITFPTTADGNGVKIGGLPFNNITGTLGCGFSAYVDGTAPGVVLRSQDNTANIFATNVTDQDNAPTNATFSGRALQFTYIYQV